MIITIIITNRLGDRKIPGSETVSRKIIHCNGRRLSTFTQAVIKFFLF